MNSSALQSLNHPALELLVIFISGNYLVMVKDWHSQCDDILISSPEHGQERF